MRLRGADMHRKLIAIACLGAMILVLTGVALADSTNERTAAKQATASFTQLARAKAAGYKLELKTTPANGAKSCIADPAGGMGVHMVNTALLDSAIRLRSPEALVYEPRGGSLRLVALEYVVDRKAWHDAGNTRPPKLFGRQFSLTTKNPFGLKPFYALHAWIWKRNPAGWLQPWNPSVSCPS
jgi:hypothetical protein